MSHKFLPKHEKGPQTFAPKYQNCVPAPNTIFCADSHVAYVQGSSRKFKKKRQKPDLDNERPCFYLPTRIDL